MKIVNHMPYLCLFLLCFTSLAFAQIYRCGENCYTDDPKFASSPMNHIQNIGTMSKHPPSNKGKNRQSNSSPNKSNTQNLAIAGNVKKQNGGIDASVSQNIHTTSPSQKEILRGKLLEVQTALALSQQKLNFAKRNRNVAETARLQTQIDEHRKNIRALQQEINRY